MNTTLMKNRLFEKFSPFAIGQSVWLHTKRTTDIEDLIEKELQEIYKMFFPMEATVSEQIIQLKNNEQLKRRRSNVLTIATRIGLKEADSWEKFNKWMLNSSIYKKKLNDHSIEELKELEIQMRAAEVNYNRSALKIGTKAWYHKNKITEPSEN
jgi:hypothetical protein